MTELVKSWNDGGSLSVSYEGDGDGSAIFSSDVNKGAERRMDVSFIDASRNVIVVQTVHQAAGQTTTETYTRLTYIECNGQQYIDLGYIVKEDDVIESNFILTKIASADHFLFGTAKGSAGLWFEIYSNSAYVRFGQTASVSISSSSSKYSMRLEKGKVTIGNTATTLDFEAMPESPIYLFAGRQSNGDAYSYGYYRCTKFRISDSNGLVMDLMPAKRDSDGVIGMLDLVSGAFYTSAEDPLIGGSEIQITNDYEVLDYTTFTGTELFDLGIVKSTYELEVLFQRSETKATPYLYGIVTSPHTASVTAYMSSGGSWRWGTAYKGISTNNLNEWRVRMKNGNALYNNTSSNFTKSTFTTPDTVVLGGYRAASGSLIRGYKGKVFYIRISESGTMLLDWYPCRRLSDGVEGFWDCVTQTFIEPL
jgi:hypothetical protein